MKTSPHPLRSRFIIFASAIISATLLAAAAPINLPEYGFSIEPLDAKPGKTPSSVLATFLPAQDGFAPNINVQIQPFAGTLDEYIELSKKQFDGLGVKVDDESRVDSNEWRVEYHGPMQGHDLHFFARAILHAGKVYLVTATAKETQWPTVEKTLRDHVDSLKIQ